jgi:hypothetical protein
LAKLEYKINSSIVIEKYSQPLIFDKLLGEHFSKTKAQVLILQVESADVSFFV